MADFTIGFVLVLFRFVLFIFICEMRPSGMDFRFTKMGPCLRDFGEQVAYLSGTSPYA